MRRQNEPTRADERRRRRYSTGQAGRVQIQAVSLFVARIVVPISWKRLPIKLSRAQRQLLFGRQASIAGPDIEFVEAQIKLSVGETNSRQHDLQAGFKNSP